jgi:hypothetical protein
MTRRLRCIGTWAAIGVMLTVVPALAQQGPVEASEDALGWGEDPAVERTTSSPDTLGFGADEPGSKGPLTLTARAERTLAGGNKLKFPGTLRLRVGFWTRRAASEAFAQARGTLDLGLRYEDSFSFHATPASVRMALGGHGEYDAAYLVDRDRYDSPTLDTYAWQAWVAETFLGITLGNLSLSVGRQIQNLGQGEILGFVDVLNPRDLREPGLTDLDGIRLPVLLTRLGVTFSGVNLELVVVHEARPSLMPPPLGSFSPFRQLIVENSTAGPALGTRELVLTHHPTGFAPEVWQSLGRLSFSVGRADFELYTGSILDRIGTIGNPLPADFARAQLPLPLFHSRYTLVATSGSLAAGAFLLRWEAGAQLGKTLSTLIENGELLQFGWVRRHQLDALLGVTYFGLRGGNLGIEAQQSYVINAPESSRDGMSLLWPIMRTSLAFRWMQTIGDDLLRFNIFAILIGLPPVSGGVLRAELERRLHDGLMLTAGYIMYISGDAFGPFYGFTRNDRAQVQLRWDFTLQ